MTSPNLPRNAYSDAPKQHPNLILGSLQLPFWLIFRPTAWRNHLKRIDPNLLFDFYLPELNNSHWRNPALRRLLVQIYVVFPLIDAILLGLILPRLGNTINQTLIDVLTETLFLISINLTIGILVSVALGLTFSCTYSLTYFLALCVKLSLMHLLKYEIPNDVPDLIAFCLAIGVMNCVAGGITNQNIEHSRTKQIRAVVFTLLSLVGILLGIYLAGYLAAHILIFIFNNLVQDNWEISHSSFNNAIETFNDKDRATKVLLSVVSGILISLLYRFTFQWRRQKGWWNDEQVTLLNIVIFAIVGIIVLIVKDLFPYAIIFTVLLCALLCMILWRKLSWRYDLNFKEVLTSTIIVGITVGSDYLLKNVIYQTIHNIFFTLFFGIFLAILFVRAERVAGSWAGGFTCALGCGGVIILGWANDNNEQVKSLWFLGLIAILLGLTINWWRPIVLYPFIAAWNTMLYHADDKSNGTSFSKLRYHSAFWDEFQYLPLSGLNEHIVLVAERNPTEGQAAMDYLIATPQRWAAQAAQIELDARKLERCADVQAISNVHPSLQYDELQSPISTLLNIFSRISQDVDAALNQQSSYNQRLALRAVVDRLDGRLQNFARSSNKYAPRFHPIVQSWRQIIINYVEELAKATELRQEIDSPYITGLPLTQEQEIFTGRNHIGTRIEQLILDRRRPPLLLYGQRRMGKTSLLYNLGRLLPNTIIPMFVDLQGAPSSASDHAGFLYNLAKGMVDSAKRQSALTLPPLTREALQYDAFTCFNEWLDKVEQALEQNTALLALDEFEVLDSAIARGRFDEQDVLGMLRHLIQHRPRFKVLLAGSHTIEEYQRWASYLINVQVVHITYLKEDEARQLIERPVKDFTLRYEPDAVERVLQLTRCHPCLIQLLCGEIVALKNEQDPSVRRLATLTDVEAAVPKALSSGKFFFVDIQNNQVNAAGLAILRFLAAQGEGAIVSRSTMLQQLPNVSQSAFELLLQRELIEEVGEGYRFQVELIRRWFVQ